MVGVGLSVGAGVGAGAWVTLGILGELKKHIGFLLSNKKAHAKRFYPFNMGLGGS